MTGQGDERLAAEQRARVLIDRQLEAAGWLVQDKSALNLFAGPGVAVREAVMAAGHGRADYLQRRAFGSSCQGAFDFWRNRRRLGVVAP